MCFENGLRLDAYSLVDYMPAQYSSYVIELAEQITDYQTVHYTNQHECILIQHNQPFIFIVSLTFVFY